jgi:hypothetical protein
VRGHKVVTASANKPDDAAVLVNAVVESFTEAQGTWARQEMQSKVDRLKELQEELRGEWENQARKALALEAVRAREGGGPAEEGDFGEDLALLWARRARDLASERLDDVERRMLQLDFDRRGAATIAVVSWAKPSEVKSNRPWPGWPVIVASGAGSLAASGLTFLMMRGLRARRAAADG